MKTQSEKYIFKMQKKKFEIKCFINYGKARVTWRNAA